MISPTSYSLLNRCHRAWWFRYVEKRPAPRTRALENGAAVHAAVEAYLLTGAWPEGDTPELYQARRAEGVLQANLLGVEGARIEVAADLDLTPWGGVDRLGGRVDWSVDGEPPRIVDHKTTANPDRWLSPERLATDSQLLAYAGALYPGRDVTVGHLYIPPPPIEPALITATATAATIDEVLRSYAEATVRMETIRAATAAELVEARTEGCFAYGGCPYADVCSAAPASLRARFTKEDRDVSTTPAPLTAAQIERRRRLGLPVPSGTPAASIEPTTPAPATERALPTVPPETPETPPAEVAPVEDALVPPDAPPAEEPPKKSRRKKAETPAAVQPGEAVLSTTGVSAVGVAATSGPARPLVLIGCVSSVPGTTLEEWVPEILEAAAGTAGHYLLVGYARGPLEVAASIAAGLKAGTLKLPERLVLPADHPCAPALGPTLAKYGEIIRSVR